MELHENLRLLRKAKKIKQRELAEGVGITQAYLSYIEKGKRNPTLDIVEKIAGELDCEIVLIFKKD